MKYRMVSLGNLIEKTENVRCGDHQYPVLSMTMHEGLVFQDNKFKKIIASKDKSDYKVVYRNQLVIGFPIDEGVLAAQRVTDIGIVSPAYTIWSINQGQIISEFLEYALRCEKSIHYYKAKLRGSTARRRSLPTPTLLEHTIPVPDKAEQERILNIIHNVKNVIAYRKEEIKALDNLIKARFVEMFGDPKANPFEWITSTVGELILSCEAGWSGNGKQRKKKDGEIAVLKVSAVTKGYFDSDECKVLDDQDIIKKYVYPQAGDLLFSRANTREMVGATAVITQDYPEHILSDKLWRVRFCDAANVWYMKYVLSSKSIRSIFSSVSNGTSGSMFNVSMGKFKSIRIPLPPIELQQQFAAFVAQVDKSKAAVQKALDETQLLFDSLMQEYFG